MTNHNPKTFHSSHEDTDSMTFTARSEWQARRIILGTLTVIGIALIFLLVYRLYMVVFLLFAAIALQVALSPLIEWMRRRHVPRKFGVLLVYATLLILLGIGAWYGMPPAINQAADFLEEVPEYYEDGRALLTDAPISLVRRLGRLLPEEATFGLLVELTEENGPDGDGDNTTTLDLIWIALRTIFAVLAIFVLAYYWTLEGNTILRKFVMKAPASQRGELRTLIDEFQEKIGAYFRGTAVLCAIVGVASTAAFLLIGIPRAIMLGLIMAVFEALPVIGPVLGAIPAILVTLTVAPEKTLWVIGALLLIQGIEGNYLVPRVMDESVGVNPIVSLLAITAFGALFGVGGALLAIPLAAILQILLVRLLFNTPVRQDMSTPSSGTEAMSRSHVGVLRLETQEIIEDLHKNLHETDENYNAEGPTVDQLTDQLEGLAAELDTWLARLEAESPSPQEEEDENGEKTEDARSAQLPADKFPSEPQQEQDSPENSERRP